MEVAALVMLNSSKADMFAEGDTARAPDLAKSLLKIYLKWSAVGLLLHPPEINTIMNTRFKLKIMASKNQSFKIIFVFSKITLA